MITLLITLGCSNNRRAIVINADDAGLHQSVNSAIVKLLESDSIHSASIMVPAPASSEIIQYAKQHPEISWGIHLTLTSEWPNYRWPPLLSRELVPSLVDSDGYLWRRNSDVLKNATLDEIEKELRAQIERVTSQGVTVTHLDTHMHVLWQRNDLLALYFKLARSYGLTPIVFKSSDLSSQFERGLPAELHFSDNAHCYHTFDFYSSKGYSTTHSNKASYYQNLLSSTENKSIIIPIHPVENDRELQEKILDYQKRLADFNYFKSNKSRELINRDKAKLEKPRLCSSPQKFN